MSVNLRTSVVQSLNAKAYIIHELRKITCPVTSHWLSACSWLVHEASLNNMGTVLCIVGEVTLLEIGIKKASTYPVS